MSENLIVNFMHPFISQFSIHSQVENIFFESSSKKTFINQKERDEFQWKYLGFYLTNYPEYAWVFLNGPKVLGYVVGMPFTKDSSLFTLQPHLKKFESLFSDYPAHLHINCHVEGRGQGIGRFLVEQLLGQIRQESVPGIHIMTGISSDNRFFYEKLGFSFSHISGEVLFMGKRLAD